MHVLKDLSGEYGVGRKAIWEEQLPDFLWKLGAFKVAEIL